VDVEQATSHAVAEPVAEVRTYVEAQPAAYADETGLREGQGRGRLWTVVSAGVSAFAIRLSRSGKVAQELVREHFKGWLVTTRWTAYPWYSTWRQLCWAHLVRGIEGRMARGGRSAEIGEALQVQVRKMFH
jgi:Transposase IS66 family